MPLPVFTGATSRTTRDRMPQGEAEHYRDRAVALGVSEQALLVEPHTRNTGENIRFSRALLDEQHVPVASVLLISKPYEERRAYATARRLWPDVEWVGASASLTFPEYVASIQDARLVIDMLVGALQFLLLYPAQGFMVAQDVPEGVRHAYERLAAQGFTGRLIPEEATSNYGESRTDPGPGASQSG